MTVTVIKIERGRETRSVPRATRAAVKTRTSTVPVLKTKTVIAAATSPPTGTRRGVTGTRIEIVRKIRNVGIKTGTGVKTTGNQVLQKNIKVPVGIRNVTRIETSLLARKTRIGKTGIKREIRRRKGIEKSTKIKIDTAHHQRTNTRISLETRIAIPVLKTRTEIERSIALREVIGEIPVFIIF